MANSIQLDLDFGAVSSFIGYLSGNVVEIRLAIDGRDQYHCVVVEGEAPTDSQGPGIQVRHFDEQLGQPRGEAVVVDIDDVRGISVY